MKLTKNMSEEQFNHGYWYMGWYSDNVTWILFR